MALGWFSLIVISAQPTEEQIEEKEAVEEEKEQEKGEKEQKKKDEEAEKEKSDRKAEDEWENYRLDLLDHYSDAGIVNIQANKQFSVFYAIIHNEYKLYSEEEKQYYVDEIGTFLEEDINAHFDSSVVHVYFHYEDGNTMVSRKISGGWKIK